MPKASEFPLEFCYLGGTLERRLCEILFLPLIAKANAECAASSSSLLPEKIGFSLS